VAVSFNSFKFEDGSKYRLIPGKEYYPFIDYVDYFGPRSRFRTTTHPDPATVGECPICDHENDHKYQTFRDKIMAEAVTEI
jgi:hypothetical protein